MKIPENFSAYYCKDLDIQIEAFTDDLLERFVKRGFKIAGYVFHNESRKEYSDSYDDPVSSEWIYVIRWEWDFINKALEKYIALENDETNENEVKAYLFDLLVCIANM